MKKRLAVLIILCMLCVSVFAQESINYNQQDFEISISKTIEKIVLDGNLNESVWQTNTSKAQNFWMKFPSNQTKAKEKTEVQLCYDNQFLYIGAKIYDSLGKYSVTSLKRDQGLRSGDGFAVVLDPFNQKTNGFFFVVTPFNTQSEDVYSSSNYDIDFSWDNKWFSQTKIYNGYWTVEIAIPFNILRFDANKLLWGINFLRSDRKKNEFHSWTQMPLQFRGIDLGYTGALKWTTPPPKTGTNISVNPYALGSVFKAQEKNAETKANTGFDAKVAVTPSLNLDLTVNPDFSQVDVDRQVSNLTRFNIFFPERRTFFLENNDLFSSYGIPPIRPFYSRRIGSKNGEAVPILFGARLSGNLSKKTRIGLMNITTGKKGENSGDNFTAVSINQQVLSRSAIKGYVLNRQDLDNTSTKISSTEKYSRNAGIELQFTDKTGNWNGWYGLHLSKKPDINTKNYYHNIGGEYNGQNINAVIDVDYIGENYFVDMGFESVIENYDAARDTSIRLGAKFIYTSFKYTWYGKSFSKWNTISTEAENFFQFTPDGKSYEFNNELTFNYNTKKTAGVSLNLQNKTSFLRYPFKFVDDDNALPIPAAKYHYATIGLRYNSDGRKDKSFGIGAEIGKFYNANYFQVNGNIALRKQPKYSIIINSEFNSLKFPSIYGTQNIFLVAPQFEYNFSNKMFWTTFFQLNTQSNNVNINSRLQYRFRPMSDLFIVYTDNYFSNPLFSNKNKAVVVKMNYWLNL
jgi:hypothetical protein